MAALKLMSLGLEALCVTICAALLIHQRLIHAQRQVDRWFRLALCANIGMLVGDAVNQLLAGTAGMLPRLLMTLAMSGYYAASGLLLFSFFAYAYTYMQRKMRLPRSLMTVCAALMTAQVTLAACSPLSGAVFVLTPQNVCLRGALYPATKAINFAIIAMGFGVLAYGWERIGRKEKVYFFLYMLLPFAAEVAHVVYDAVSLLNVALTVTFLMVHLFINSEIDEQLRQSSEQLEEERARTLQSLQEGQERLVEQTIIALSNAVEAKDRYTNGHSLRVARYAQEIVRRMGGDHAQQQRVFYAGLLHDVGKIRTPDVIINKTDRLTQEEYEEVKLHSMAGYYILKEISPIAEFAACARWHHERYDGRGYPNGLSGENIPLVARIIGVADAYDAMTSTRSYREVMPQQAVRREIVEGMGTQFDPEIAKVMLQMIDEDVNYKLSQPDVLTQKTILAIDDDAMTLHQLAYIFQLKPFYRLVSACSGEEGIQRMREQPVDLVLLDVEMRGMNGYDVLAWVRENRSGVPVVFMTGDKDLRMIMRAERMGVSDYLTKPLVPRMLMESIQNILLNSRNFQGCTPVWSADEVPPELVRTARQSAAQREGD